MTDKFVAWAKQVSKRTDEARHYMNEQGVLGEHIFWNGLPRATLSSLIGTLKIWQRQDLPFNQPREK